MQIRTETANSEGRKVKSAVFMHAPRMEGSKSREDGHANGGGSQRGLVAVGFEFHGTCFGIHSDCSTVHAALGKLRPEGGMRFGQELTAKYWPKSAF